MKKSSSKRSDSLTTIERIIQSATQLFSTKGFQKTLVQDIAKDAGCNAACINYHFHGKEKLYKEIFKRQISETICPLHSPEINEDDNHFNALENNLRSVVNLFMSSSGYPTLLMGLIYHEMIDPHLPDDFCVNETLRPLKKHLHDLFQQNLPSLEADSADLCVLSFAGQLLHLINIIHLFNPSNRSVFSTEQAIRHIVEFSAAGAIYLSVKDQYKHFIDQIDED